MGYIARLSRWFLLISINLVVFYFLFNWFRNNVQGEKIIFYIESVRNSSIVFSLCLGVAILFFYALRMKAVANTKFKDSFGTINLGFGFNNVLPFRLGDVVKVILAKKFFKISMSKLIMVKIYEKFLDLSVLLLIVLVSFLSVGFFFKLEMFKFLFLFIMLCVICALSFSFLFMKSKRFSEWVVKLPIISYFLGVIIDLYRNQHTINIIIYTVLIWVSTIVLLYGYFVMNLNVDFGLVDALFLVVLTSISLGLPTSPAAVGVFESAIVFYLSNFLKVGFDQALALSIILHIVIAIPQIVIALVVLFVKRHKLGFIR